MTAGPGGAAFALYLITDASLDADALCRRTEAALAAAAPGEVALQLRLKDWDPDLRRAVGHRLRDLCRTYGAPLLVNGDLALWRALDADGVQLPEASGDAAVTTRRALGPARWLGRSCHDAAGLADAAAVGADFATLSPFHAVPGKGAPLDPAQVQAWLRAAALPVYALGGIGAGDVEWACRLGAHGVAVIRAVYGHPQPAQAVDELLRSLRRARPTRTGPAP